MNVTVDSFKQFVLTTLTNLGLKILGAFALWIIGRWLINLAVSMIGRGMTRQKIDPTLIRWIQNAPLLCSISRWWLPSSDTSGSRPRPSPP